MDYAGFDIGADVDDDVCEIAAPSATSRPSKRRKVSAKKDEDYGMDLEDCMYDDATPSEGLSMPHSRDLHVSKRVALCLEGLLEWYDKVKDARGMPWRKVFDPTLDDDAKAQRAYEVLVSEIMLQQTQVSPFPGPVWVNRFP